MRDGGRLVGVTSSGSWSVYEGTDEPFLSRWNAGVVADVLVRN
jgi:hypothetical protein